MAQVTKIMLPSPSNPRAMANYTFTLRDNLYAMRDAEGAVTVYRTLAYGAEPLPGYSHIPGLNYNGTDIPVLCKPIKMVAPKSPIGNCLTDGKNVYSIPPGKHDVYVLRGYFK